ncbi:synaptotagmin-4-like [Cololabis saira]|uniref:synaptotagmin-4-like n=1 Tax=Cololabis saira TaxID=129043 RepID=UPI002AD53B49|nr:synaptotagmin-4-like [Cololabis saira]
MDSHGPTMQFHLGVQLQILLAVGLAVFCYCIVLGCILCCRRRKSVSSEDKEAAFSSPCPVSRATATLIHPPSTQPVRQQYEELDGDVLEFPSSKTEDDLSALPGEPGEPCPTGSADPMRSPRSFFPMRRLSSPAAPASPGKAPSHGRASLPSLTKPSIASKSRHAMVRRCTVSGDGFAYDESSRLTARAAGAPGAAGAAVRQGEAQLSQYGSGSLSSSSPKSAPLLHFSLLFSAACGSLVVKVLGILLDSRRRSGIFVQVSLPPLFPRPQDAAPRRRGFSLDPRSHSFVLQVGSAEQLRSCTLKLAVCSRDFSGLRETALGAVELPCEQMDWEPDVMTTHTRELNPAKRKIKKQSVSSQETSGRRKSSVSVPLALGQLLILLQHQAPAQRIKVMVRKAENLAKLTRIPGAPDHYVVINLRQDGKVISSKETKVTSRPNPVWNAPFLFDLPPGDVTQLPLALEFIVMQGRLYTKSSILGRVLIGREASEAGEGHWREMCTPGQTETTRWHTVQSDAL